MIQCLGPLAPACMDALFLLDNDNTPDNAYAYIGIMNGLAFDCGAGFYGLCFPLFFPCILSQLRMHTSN